MVSNRPLFGLTFRQSTQSFVIMFPFPAQCLRGCDVATSPLRLTQHHPVVISRMALGIVPEIPLPSQPMRHGG